MSQIFWLSYHLSKKIVTILKPYFFECVFRVRSAYYSNSYFNYKCPPPNCKNGFLKTIELGSPPYTNSSLPRTVHFYLNLHMYIWFMDFRNWIRRLTLLPSRQKTKWKEVLIMILSFPSRLLRSKHFLRYLRNLRSRKNNGMASACTPWRFKLKCRYLWDNWQVVKLIYFVEYPRLYEISTRTYPSWNIINSSVE